MKRRIALHARPVLHAIAIAAMGLVIAGCDDNSAPFASAGVNQSVLTGTTLSLDASGSTDADGNPITFNWTLLSKPDGSTATIMGATTAKPSFTPDLPGTYVASVTVSDGEFTSAAATVTITASDVVGFDSMPNPLPETYPSYGFEAYAIKSIGDQATLKAGSPHGLAAFEVGLTSWACQTGTWNAGCVTTDTNATFSHPVTVSFYNNAGTLLATKTQTFAMPFRPTPDPTCPSTGQWRAPSGTCVYGRPFKVKFDMRSLKAVLPDSFYWEVTVNTNVGGTAPLGTPGYYDAINIGTFDALTVSPSIGTDPKPGIIRWDGADDPEDLGLPVTVTVQAP